MSARPASAQSYPARPVRMVVGFPPGQSIDIVARVMAQWLWDRLGQQFVIENRPGAGGNIATEGIVRSAPDGYSLMVMGANNAINATLYENLNFNAIRDLVPVGGIYRVPQVMVVHPDLPAKTVAEFIAYAKANPGKINVGSAGVGSVAHVTCELFKMMTGTDMLHVPYRGGPQAITDLLGGQVQVVFDNLPSSIEHIRGGRLRALGVSTTSRLEGFPDLPTIGETVAGFETSAFAGVSAPKGTPPEIIEKLSTEMQAGHADANVRAKIYQIGGFPLSLSSDGFGKFFADETEKWRRAVKFSGAPGELRKARGCRPRAC